VVVGGTWWPSQPLFGYAHAMTLSYLTCSRIVSACIPAHVRPPCITMPLTARTHPVVPPLPCICLVSAFLLCALPTKTRDICSQSSRRCLLEQSSLRQASRQLSQDRKSFGSAPQLSQDNTSISCARSNGLDTSDSAARVPSSDGTMLRACRCTIARPRLFVAAAAPPSALAPLCNTLSGVASLLLARCYYLLVLLLVAPRKES
jgi:hypothetical protein